MPDQPQRCETCRFFEAIYQDHSLGLCRRYPPYPEGLVAPGPPRPDKSLGFWPETEPDEWCGEYQPTSNTSDNTSVFALDLPTRARKAFYLGPDQDSGRDRIRTIDDLCSWRGSDLMRYHRQIGKTTVGRIRAALWGQYGRTLADNEQPAMRVSYQP